MDRLPRVNRLLPIIQFQLATVTLLPLMGLWPVGGCTGPLRTNPAVRYIAFGDSTTDGPTDRNYWVLLGAELGESAAAFTNEGRGGEITSEGLDRLKTLLAANTYPNARILLYWQGGGDVVKFIQEHDPLLAWSPDDPGYPCPDEWQSTLDRIQTTIESAVRLGQNNGLRVYVTTYYFLREHLRCKPALLETLPAAQADRARGYVAHLNERIRRAARNTGADVVDVESRSAEILGDPANYVDCNHLSPAGNAIVAELFLDALTRPPTSTAPAADREKGR